MTDASGCLQIVVMGVTATGKSAVAARLAERLGLAVVEGDDFHSRHNIEKMAAGIPLTDDDRRPWLESIAERIAGSWRSGRSAIVTCSALRRSYREILRGQTRPQTVFFVHLVGDVALLHERMVRRTGHFMPPTLLQSQLATLEPLEPDEDGVAIDTAPPIDDVVEQVLLALRSRDATAGNQPRLCHVTDR